MQEAVEEAESYDPRTGIGESTPASFPGSGRWDFVLVPVMGVRLLDVCELSLSEHVLAMALGHVNIMWRLGVNIAKWIIH